MQKIKKFIANHVSSNFYIYLVLIMKYKRANTLFNTLTFSLKTLFKHYIPNDKYLKGLQYRRLFNKVNINISNTDYFIYNLDVTKTIGKTGLRLENLSIDYKLVLDNSLEDFYKRTCKYQNKNYKENQQELLTGIFEYIDRMRNTIEKSNRSDKEKIINYYTRRGFIKGGLYNKLPDKIAPGVYPYYLDENGRCLIWYISAHEYSWFKYFMRRDMKDRAKEIIDDCIRFGMTKDYYMLERYNERDPYFGPWMPNASANGRLLNMLLDYYL